jgi:energy-coupling factor transport system permease protein
MLETVQNKFSTFHPFINLFYFCVTIGMTVFVTHPVILAISLCSGIACFVMQKGGKSTIRMLLYSLPFVIIIALMNPLFNHYGVTILGYFYNGNPFTLESCVYGVVMAVMLLSVLIWFGYYTEIMTSDKFIYLFGKILPVLSLVLSMSLRFVPRFLEQQKVIHQAQMCVGRDGADRGILSRIRAGIRNFSILVTWSLENAIETADSMKCRAYGEKGRTAYSIYRFDRQDRICLGSMIILFGITLYGARSGWFYSSYNPQIRITGIPLTIKSFLAYAAFTVFCMFPTIMEAADKKAWQIRRMKLNHQQPESYRLWEVSEHD